jgi:hypothetical protein
LKFLFFCIEHICTQDYHGWVWCGGEAAGDATVEPAAAGADGGGSTNGERLKKKRKNEGKEK